MKLHITRRRFVGALIANGLLSGCVADPAKEIYVPPDPSPATDGPGVQPVPASTLPLASLTAMAAKTLFIAHRGAAALYPEETYTAYDECIRSNQLLLECDVQTLTDGTTGVIHDETVDRTTSGRGRVSSFNAHQLRQLRVDAESWHRSNYGNNLAVGTFSDWVSRYRGKAILIPEDKDQRSAAHILAVLIGQGVHRDQVLIQSFGLNSVKLVDASGYPACFLTYTPSSLPKAVEAGVKWAGISSAFSDEETRHWVATGMRVLVWTVNRRFERDLKLALGVTGFFSDDPAYLQSDAPLATKDRFNLGRWTSGMYGSDGTLDSWTRGKFFSGGYWGYDAVTAGYAGCLQGYLCPVKGQTHPQAYSVNLTVKFDAALGNDETRWASLFIGVDDRAFVDADEQTSGYHVLFRKNGTLDIYKKAPGVRGLPLATKSGTAVVGDEDCVYRVTVSETLITAARLNEDGSEAYSATADDRSSRGGYLHLGRNGVACRFKQVSIS